MCSCECDCRTVKWAFPPIAVCAHKRKCRRETDSIFSLIFHFQIFELNIDFPFSSYDEKRKIKRKLYPLDCGTLSGDDADRPLVDKGEAQGWMLKAMRRCFWWKAKEKAPSMSLFFFIIAHEAPADMASCLKRVRMKGFFGAKNCSVMKFRLSLSIFSRSSPLPCGPNSPATRSVPVRDKNMI